ncbi:MAG: dTDP-4-dehydrorhamnose reductase [Victivallales bacterium]|nr:dTDP-4-dehydrorhamnose reductase [Victivallales bacterium]
MEQQGNARIRSVAVLGNGMLGTEFAKMAREQGLEVKVFAYPDWDVTCETDVALAVDSADCIVNCTAYTAVDKAESEPELCAAVNATALLSLGKAAAAKNKYLLHISTDFVFGDYGSKPLSETDAPNPLNVYGATKLKGEELLLSTGCRCAIIRVQWTYGQHGTNFVFKIIELARKLNALKVVDDQIGSPTSTHSISRAIMCFIRKNVEGVYHFATEGYASRYDIAMMIVRKLHIDIPVSPCATTEFKTPAARPLNSRFDCSKIDKVLDFKRPSWEADMEAFLDAIA